MKSHFEIVSARIWYGRHATGAVLLRNGYCEHHGTKASCKRILKNHLEFMERIVTKET